MKLAMEPSPQLSDRAAHPETPLSFVEEEKNRTAESFIADAK